MYLANSAAQFAADDKLIIRDKGHLGMRVSAPPLTLKLKHMPHDSSQSQLVVTVDAAEAAASVSS